jgi:hypothetical protein
MLFVQQTNVALHKPVETNSEAPGFPAKNITDDIISEILKKDRILNNFKALKIYK